jgi:hypothetical protein
MSINLLCALKGFVLIAIAWIVFAGTYDLVSALRRRWRR